MLVLPFALGLAAAPAQARLLPRAADLPGASSLRPDRGAVARELAAGRQSSDIRALLKRADGEVASFRIAGGRLTLAAFAVPTSQRAKQLLGTWTRARRASRLPLADGGSQRRAATKRTTTVVTLVRVGRALGFVRLETTEQGARANDIATAYARQLAATMAAELSLQPFDRAARNTLADRVVTKTEALKAFALAYGGLPGYPALRGQQRLLSGTLPLAWILRFRDNLGPKLRRAVAARIDGRWPAAARRLAGGDELVLLGAKTADAEGYVRQYLERMGVSFSGGLLPFPMRVYEDPAGLGDADADAITIDSLGLANPFGTTECRIRLAPSLLGAGAEAQRFALAHEAFHCVQAAVIGGGWTLFTDAWVLEGTADWAATQIVDVSYGVGGGAFQDYLRDPEGSLFERTYDAVGFFGAANQLTGDLWSRMSAILTADPSVNAFAAAGGADAAFAEVWASGLERQDPTRTAWFVKQPWSVFASVTETPHQVIAGNSGLSAPDHANRLARVTFPSARPLLELTVSGAPARIGVDDQDIVVNGVATFCEQGRCVCPPDEISSFPPFTELGGRSFDLALSGWTSGAQAELVFRGVDEFCTPREPDRPGGSGSEGGGGASIADPHLYTMDGLNYEFQAAGEFVLLRSTGGDLEMQARMEPWGGSPNLTINTQFGFRVEGKQVVVSSGRPMKVVVSGRELAAGQTAALGGATVEHGVSDRPYALITWPDGSVATVVNHGPFVDGIVQLAESRRGQVRGLLGNFDGDPGNDLVARNGTLLRHTVTPYRGSLLAKARIVEEETRAFQTTLYDGFGESWRVAQRDSLLRYGPGQSTRTFTDRTVPRRFYDRSNLPASVRRRAERICRERGVRDPAILEDCILDVGATGNEAFAEAAARYQAAAALGWRRLAWGAGLDGDVELARTPDGSLHLASTEIDAATGALRLTSVSIGRDGREGPASVIAEPADAAANAHLTAAPDGTLLATVAGRDPASGVLGTFGFTSAPPYSAWTPRRLIAQGGATFVGEPASVVAADGTQLTVAPGDGLDARVLRGFAPEPPVAETPFSSPVSDLSGCRAGSPALASEATAIWLAWTQFDCPLRGLYVARLDPAQVGGPGGVVTATRAVAPDSFWPGLSPFDYPNIGYFDRVALATRPGLPGTFVAYPSFAGGSWRVVLWRIGDPSAVEVARSTSEPRVPLLAADPSSGRLWVAWSERGSLRVRLTRPDGLAFAGRVHQFDPPPGSASGRWSIAARDERLAVVYAVRGGGAARGEVWLGSLAVARTFG